jgi:hypothetical protein
MKKILLSLAVAGLLLGCNKSKQTDYHWRNATWDTKLKIHREDSLKKELQNCSL